MYRAFIIAGVIGLATVASRGDIIFNMNSSSSAIFSGGVYSGSFDIYLSVGPGDTYSLADWQATVQSADAGFVITSASSAVGSVFASLSHTDMYRNPVTDTSDIYQGGESLDLYETPPLLVDGVVLMTVSYEAASLGTFAVNFTPTYDVYPAGPSSPVPVSGGLSLGDEFGVDIPFSYVSGNITVTPEPAMTALLAAGVAMLLRRRKTKFHTIAIR